MVSRARLRRGYTLVELMVVVAIIAILATLAVYGVKKYVLAAKTAEPIEILNGIRAAEESYKDETFRYLSVTTASSFFPFSSADELKNSRKAWQSGDSTTLGVWDQLGVRPSTEVQFGYACTAGNTDDPPSNATLGITGNLGLPAANGNWWYVARATGDRDGNGKRATFVATNFSDHIYSEDETE